MMPKTEIIRWLNTLDDDAAIAIDDGGLTLVELHPLALVETGSYCEVGGIPLAECDQCKKKMTEPYGGPNGTEICFECYKVWFDAQRKP